MLCVVPAPTHGERDWQTVNASTSWRGEGPVGTQRRAERRGNTHPTCPHRPPTLHPTSAHWCTLHHQTLKPQGELKASGGLKHESAYNMVINEVSLIKCEIQDVG